MPSDYEKLREEQLEFLDKWNQSFDIPARNKAKHDHFRVELKENDYAWINKKFVEVQAV